VNRGTLDVTLLRIKEEKEMKKEIKMNESDTMEIAKMRKIAHYLTRDLTEFRQFDGFCDVQEDSFMSRDVDGDDCWSSRTEELMTGIYNVRILITKGTTAKDAIRLINKLNAWLAREPEFLDFKDNSDTGGIAP
jgi:hypothetical protein